ncbi:grasp-with-spasm system SPASM domain peptide maturase [Sphingobacterium thalpophilum]|uniref:SPASM domain peptide maturase, grasp-with-spasm system n=1 Tax=Sphingobacterium thalpophilum TaxID=259 RepID=A0A4U9V1X0_9SPHI|nr:grasp-with-spasm system SPASM domain peptide maturase [Sphingobacterium thalpophilum]VTR36674.1 SPASM domain peptide maturase, grasp-with-spasm system [Sphingobacterium thalpophilum]
MNNNMYLVLFPSCKLVKGAKRSIICDLKSGVYATVPHSLYNLIENLLFTPYDKYKNSLSESDQEILEEYREYLIEHQFAFFTSNPNNFSVINEEFFTPSIVTNAIIKVAKTSSHNFGYLFSQLSDLGCKAIEFRFSDIVLRSGLEEILDLLRQTRVQSVNLFLKFASYLLIEGIRDLVDRYKFITSINIYNSPFTSNDYIDNTHTTIKYTIGSNVDNLCCGDISPSNFAVNIPMYTEALKYNTCLNRKISIDESGEIKNCPSLNSSYGNLKNVRLEEVVFNDDFRKMWEVNKDIISVCRDCEFRYICLDCRAFTHGSNIYGKPEKCKYNPYE